MKPIVGWWSILRPLVYVGFGLRKQAKLGHEARLVMSQQREARTDADTS